MNKIILGFTGEIASGKGTASAYLTTKYGAPSYRFSTVLRDILTRLSLPIDRDHMQRLSMALRTTFGSDVLSHVIAADVASDSAAVIAVDGVRRLEDIIGLTNIPGFVLVAITANEQLRWQRLRQRGENADDTTKTFDQFKLDQQGEAEQQIRTAVAKANYTITNDGAREEFYQQIDALLQTLGYGNKS